MLPLAGVKVLELGAVVLAPYAAQWLADLGAEVVKVEPPTGDSTRRTGPAAEPGQAALFLSVNRNKQSVALDLKTPAGREALLALVDQADVLIHNNRPQKMRALGLDPDTLRKRNTRLVYACLHGFGEDGPYGGRPAYDDTIQGLSGLVDLVRQGTGTINYVPTIVADKTAALTAAIAIIAALYRQKATGEGSYVEVPMFESLVAFTAVEHLWGHHFEPPRGPASYARASTARRPFATSDGHICLLPYTDRHWRDLAQHDDLADLSDDPRLASIETRTAVIGALYGRLEDSVAKQTTAYWIQFCEAREIPFAPVRGLAELTEDPHLLATGFFTKLPAGDGELRFPGSPALFDGERPPINRPPRLGEHTRSALAAAGLSEAEIDALYKSGAAA